jgi:hypothetical protein
MLMQRARLTPVSAVRYHCRKFRLALVINLKTGKALGITGPHALLAHADEDRVHGLLGDSFQSVHAVFSLIVHVIPRGSIRRIINHALTCTARRCCVKVLIDRLSRNQFLNLRARHVRCGCRTNQASGTNYGETETFDDIREHVEIFLSPSVMYN